MAKKTLDEMLLTGKKVFDIISEDDLKGLTDEELEKICSAAVEQNEKAVKDYMSGKVKAIKSLVGFVMKETKGRADANLAEEILVKILQQKG